jgi:hypothetical protein
MKILYIASNPDDASPLQIEKEANLLREKLDAITTSEPLDLRVYASLDVATLPEVIARAAPDVLHFAAHGEGDGIVLAHQDRGTVLLDGHKLAKLLAAVSVRPKLVVVNACRSTAMAEALCRAADFTIGIDAPISNVGARTMAANLYQRLAASASLHDAFSAAATMLEVIDEDQARAVLFPTGSEQAARRTRLAHPLRIVASFPIVEDWLEHGHVTPQKGFDQDQPEIQFGLAGCPRIVRQVQLFTDDDTVQPEDDESLADARSWMLEKSPSGGEVWIKPTYTYYGSMQWFGSVVTAEPRILSAAATTVEALERYYFDEAWRGELPPDIADLVGVTISNLRANDGSRRGRHLKVKMKRPKRG